MSKDWRLQDSGSKYASQCFHVIAKMREDIILINIVASMAPYGGTIHTPSLTLCKEKLSYLTCATGLLQVFDSKTILNLGEFISPSRTHTEKPRHLQPRQNTKTLRFSSGRKAITNVEFFQVSRLAGPHTQWGPWPNLRPQLNQSRCERCSLQRSAK